MTMRAIALSFLFLITATACGVPDSHPNSQLSMPQMDDTISLNAGTPAGVGIIRLLNDSSTHFELLDDEIGLDRRAARGLILRRNGPDGVFGTQDDRHFQTIAQISAVKWVGDRTLSRLAVYAATWGWAPAGDDELGTYENVLFSVEQATECLQLINVASERMLDERIGLDKRAVNSIIAARPIRSIEHLASLHFVGHRALQHLRDHTLTH